MEKKKITYNKITDDRNIKILWHNKVIINSNYPYGYNEFEVISNNFHKKYKFRLYSDSGMFDILNIEKTKIFCEKEYIVLSFIEYRQASDTYAENNYFDMYISTNVNDENISGVLNYDLLGQDTNGPVALELINKLVKYKCTKNRIEFIYPH